MHRHHLTFAVAAIIWAAIVDKVHIAFVVRLTGDIAVIDAQTVVVLPSGSALTEAFAPGAHALGIDVTVSVFPATLKQYKHFASIFLVESLLLAEPA